MFKVLGIIELENLKIWNRTQIQQSIYDILADIKSFND